MEEFLQRKFPGWRVRKILPIGDVLSTLFDQGHVRVYKPDKIKP